VSFLKKNNINTAIHYPETFYKSKAYQEYNNLNFIADEMKNKLLSLPMYPEMPLNDVYKVTTCLKEFF
jgi:dTDP-4-amino-4,6-dideoxygalactose transaminase